MRMKISSLAVLVAGISLSFNSVAMSFNDAKQIYSKLVYSNHVSRPIPLKLDPSKFPNAWTNWRKITVTRGLLRNVANRDELALIIAHELGHATHRPYSNHWKEEYYADTRGAYYMQKAGYNKAIACKIFLRWNDPADPTHPSGKNRYTHLHC